MNHSSQETVNICCLADVDVFVLAGGLGTRIRPVLGDTPKLLAPIGNRTYLAYLLDWLAFFGAKRIVFGLGHGAQAIRTEFKRYPRVDLTIESVVEPQPLGTAGAVGFARNRLRTDPVLVLNGDTFVDADLCKFIDFHRAHAGKGSMLCARVADGQRYGQVRIDPNGSITAFIEKSASASGAATINAGVYLLSAALLDVIAHANKSSLELDIFPMLHPGTMRAFTGSFDFVDIGTPESLVRAVTALKHIPTPINGSASNDH